MRELRALLLELLLLLLLAVCEGFSSDVISFVVAVLL